MRLPLALAAALLSGITFAQPPTSGRAPPPATPDTANPPPAAAPAGPAVDVGAIFDKLDANHDGKLTREEAQAHPTVAANFDSADSDHDGTISKDEFLAAFKAPQ